MNDQEFETLQMTLEKMMQVIKKHDAQLKSYPPISQVTEIKCIDLEEDESPVSQINRLLREGWMLIAINQYARPGQDEQKWGSLAILGSSKR